MNKKEILDYIKSIGEPARSVKVNNRINVNGEAELVLLTINYASDELGVFSLDTAFVIYKDNTVLTLWDWQSGYPQSTNEIENYEWHLDLQEHRAIMFNGLPRIFA